MEVDPLNENVMADVSLDDAAMADAMDDLFGEATEPLDLAGAVHLPVMSLPLPPILRLRLADMQASGCCTKLTWSNSGSIAKISEDGSTIDFYIYAVDPKSGKWQHIGPTSHPIRSTDQHIFVHLQFNHLGHELAAVDDVGQVHMYSMLGGIGNMQAAQLGSEAESRTELDAVVGLHWLPIFPLDCRSLYIGTISRTPQGWTSVSRPQDQNAIKVHHPADGAKALLYLTKRGTLVFRYQHEIWRTLSYELSETDTPITHADFCEHNGNILLVIYDASASLRLYQVAIIWNATYVPGPGQSQQASAVDPRVQITWLTSTRDTAPRHMPALSLSLLQLLPRTAEVVDHDVTSATTVLATFVQTTTQVAELASFSDSATILVRWQVEPDPRVLHDSFRKLKAGTNATKVAIEKTVLRRQPDLLSSKIVLSVHSKFFDTMLVLVASDGTIEVRDRTTFDILHSYMDEENVTSLVQSGFGYESTAHNIHAAISNDGSAMAHLAAGEDLKVTNMTNRYGWQSTIAGVDGTQRLAEAAAVCIARQYMIMTCSYSSPDEVLSLLPQPLPSDLRLILCQEAFRLARHGPDITSFDERMRQNLAIKEPLMPKAYGLQLALGTKLVSSERTLTAQLAWAVLNMRHVCLSISQSIGRPDPSQPFPSESIHSLRGQCRWSVDLIVMIIGTLLSIVERSNQDSSQPAIKLFEDHMKDSSNPVALLLLCSFPRTLLKLLAQIIPRLIRFSQMSIGRARSVLERQQLTEVGMMEKTVPFTFESFKTFLDNVEVTLHASAQAETKPSLSADTMMSLTGTIPKELEHCLQSMVVTIIPSLLDAADLSKIYFADTSWLGLSGPRSIKAAAKYDVLRKLPLREADAVRKCRRCGSMMQEVSLDRSREATPRLYSAQRHCICTCNWYIP